MDFGFTEIHPAPFCCYALNFFDFYKIGIARVPRGISAGYYDSVPALQPELTAGDLLGGVE